MKQNYRIDKRTLPSFKRENYFRVSSNGKIQFSKKKYDDMEKYGYFQFSDLLFQQLNNKLNNIKQ